MSEIEQLARAATELGNHVAAAVRMSNRMESLLKDAGKELSADTKDAILKDITDMHDKFRVEHFRQMIGTVNRVVEISDKLWNEEPVSPDGPEPGESPGEPVSTELPVEPPDAPRTEETEDAQTTP